MTEVAWRDLPTSSPTKAAAVDHPCELLKYHGMVVTLTEYHHSKPVFLQNRLYGQIRYGADIYLCANCHDSVHEWLYWLLGERRAMPHVGRNARREAERTYTWYLAEKERLESKDWS